MNRPLTFTLITLSLYHELRHSHFTGWSSAIWHLTQSAIPYRPHPHNCSLDDSLLTLTWQTSPSSSLRVSTASAFRFISRTACFPYWTLNLRRRSISSCHYMDMEQSSAAYHICSVTSCLLLSLEDILLQTLLPVITVVISVKWYYHLWTRQSLLLTYMTQNMCVTVGQRPVDKALDWWSRGRWFKSLPIHNYIITYGKLFTYRC